MQIQMLAYGGIPINHRKCTWTTFSHLVYMELLLATTVVAPQWVRFTVLSIGTSWWFCFHHASYLCCSLAESLPLFDATFTFDSYLMI